MLLLTPQNFDDYELIDTGDFEKLERWGKVVTCRPEPQALWKPKLSKKDWDRTMDVRFVAQSSSSGTWQKQKQFADRWLVNYQPNIEQHDAAKLTFRLALTSFKHVGLFPEQAVNWDYIYRSVKRLKTKESRFLNLFAYTGAASLAAKAAGADVVHLDSIKQVVTWARENMEHSNLNNIRWVVEDAVAFVKREVKRGNKYHGIILDPPAYGHGPKGENWKLEDMVYGLMQDVTRLLNEEEHFLILNTYSLGFSSLIIENIFDDLFKSTLKKETGEIYLASTTGQKLPLGVFGRMNTFEKTD